MFSLLQVKILYIQSSHFDKFFKYKILNAADSLQQDLSPLFEEAHKFIDEALESGGAVLVHWY